MNIPKELLDTIQTQVKTLEFLSKKLLDSIQSRVLKLKGSKREEQYESVIQERKQKSEDAIEKIKEKDLIEKINKSDEETKSSLLTDLGLGAAATAGLLFAPSAFGAINKMYESEDEYEKVSIGPKKEVDANAKPTSDGKFSNKESFYKALFPYAQYASERLGGNVPPQAILAHWAQETGYGKALAGSFNYAGIKNFGNKYKSSNVATEENYSEQELANAERMGESLISKGAPGSGGPGKYRVKVRSNFASFDNLQEFADAYVDLLSNKRYVQAIKATSGQEFGEKLVQAGYATTNASQYGRSISIISSDIGIPAPVERIAKEETQVPVAAEKVKEKAPPEEIPQASLQSPFEILPPEQQSKIEQLATSNRNRNRQVVVNNLTKPMIITQTQQIAVATASPEPIPFPSAELIKLQYQALA